MEIEKIRRAKKRLSRLSKRYNKYTEKLRFLRDMVKRCKENKDRSICFNCGIKFTAKEIKKFKDDLPIYERKIKIIYAWIHQNYGRGKLIDIRNPITELKEKQEKAWKQKVQEYLQKNRNKLNKAIRTLDLPNIPDNEKEMWNKAIELQIDKRNIQTIDEYEVQFEILN